MNTSAKLYHVTSSECSLPLYVGPEGVANYPAHDLPQLLWPDGRVCWLVNLYLLHGYRNGRSRKNKGGTLLTWAKNLSHLVRWCYYQSKVDIVDLTESHFRMFVNFLLQEKDEEHLSEKKRSAQQVSNICSTVLNFLAYIDGRMPGLNLLGPDGRIHAEKKTIRVKVERTGRTITRTAWVHEHVPRHRRSRRRQPISTAAVNRLYEANAKVAASAFVSRRRFIMLRFLEISGGRRMEVSLVKVADILEAMQTGELKLYNAKKRDDDSYRYVPVTQADLKEILSFVKHYRERIVRTLGPNRDHGFLFVAEKTGEHLEIDTLGAEFSALRKAAGIDDEEACMHAFRHRFITNIFRDLIRTHHLQNESDLRRMLLSTETLKAKVMEWTGHSSLEALDRYIHLAFELEANFQETLDLVQAQHVIQSLHLLLKDYGAQFRASRPSQNAYSSLADIVEAAASELGTLLQIPACV